MSSVYASDMLWGDWKWLDLEEREDNHSSYQYSPPSYKQQPSQSSGSGWLIAGGIALVVGIILTLIIVGAVTHTMWFTPRKTEIISIDVKQKYGWKSLHEVCKGLGYWSPSHCVRVLRMANPGVRDDLQGTTSLLLPGDKLTKSLDKRAAAEQLRCRPQKLDGTGFRLSAECAAIPVSKHPTRLSFRVPITPVSGKIVCQHYYVTPNSPPGNPLGYTKRDGVTLQCGSR